MKRVSIVTALLLCASPAMPFQKELAEAQRCHANSAARYAKICDPVDSMASAVLGACEKEYRATIRAFAESVEASGLADSDKVELGESLFKLARDRAAYFVAEERLAQGVCLDP